MANIYIQIEIAKREQQAKFLLGLIAAERGHKVLLGHVKPLLAADVLHPGIIFDKSVTPRPKKIIEMKRAREQGHRFTAIDEESGILGEDFSSFANMRYSQDTLELADAVFFWGQFDHAYISNLYPAQKKKFYITGNPRIDLWRKEMGALFSEPINMPSSYILFASNFGGAMAKRSKDEEWQQAQTSAPHQLTKADKELFDAQWQYTKDMAEIFATQLNQLAKIFPKINFVVRPHPTESSVKWRQLLDNNQNLHLREDGSISPWIRNCKALLHCGCTSAIEAAIAEKPILSHVPKEGKEFAFAYPNRLGIKSQTSEELQSAIELLFKSDPENSTSDAQILSERLASIGGPFASERIVDLWDQLNLENNQLGFWKKSPYSHPKSAIQFVDIYGLSTHPIISKIYNKTTIGWKFPKLTQRALDKELQLFRDVLGRFKRVNARVIAPRLCVLEPANG